MLSACHICVAPPYLSPSSLSLFYLSLSVSLSFYYTHIYMYMLSLSLSSSSLLLLFLLYYLFFFFIICSSSSSFSSSFSSSSSSSFLFSSLFLSLSVACTGYYEGRVQNLRQGLVTPQTLATPRNCKKSPQMPQRNASQTPRQCPGFSQIFHKNLPGIPRSSHLVMARKSCRTRGPRIFDFCPELCDEKALKFPLSCFIFWESQVTENSPTNLPHISMPNPHPNCFWRASKVTLFPKSIGIGRK